MVTKTEKICVKLSKEEKEMLETICRYKGISKTKMIRDAILDAYEEYENRKRELSLRRR